MLNEDILLTPEQIIQINREKIWLDIEEFEQLSLSETKQLKIEKLEDLLLLYRGELLTGISLDNASDYEFWLLGQRARYTRIFESYTLDLIERLIQSNIYKKALEWSLKLLQHNPELEDVHYWLMCLYAHFDQIDVAMQQFSMYKQLMWKEFASKPSDRMELLRQQIENKDLPHLPEKIKSIVPRPLLDKEENLFIGRELELQLLNTIWQKMPTGVGAFLSISGEAGMGKSALIANFIKKNNLSQEVPVFYSSCYKSTQHSILVPWIKLIRTCVDYIVSNKLVTIPTLIINRLRLIVPDLLVSNPETTLNLVDNELNSELLLNTIVDFFCLVSKQIKLVIIVEDIHHADELSIQLFTHLLNRLSDAPLFIISSHRLIESQDHKSLQVAIAEWDKFSLYKTMRLSALQEIDITAIIEKNAPHIENKAELANKLATHTMGVTLHIIEILQEIQNTPANIEELPIPFSLKKIVLYRLQNMTESQRQLLEMLAVLDFPATLNEILECTAQNEQELILNLEQITKYRLIQSIDTDAQLKFTFSHFLFREIIYDNIADLRKRLLHQRISHKCERQALVLSTNTRQSVVNRLIYHAYNATDITRLIRWTPIAANYAKDAFAYRQALRVYENLDHLLQTSPNIDFNDYARILLNMCEILRFLGDWKVQEVILERVNRWYKSEAFQNRDLIKIFLAEYGTNQFRLGRYKIAVNYLNQAIELASRSEDELILAQSFNTLGNIAYYQGNWHEAEKNYKLGIEIREQLGDAVGSAKGYNNLGAIAYRQDNFELAVEYYEKNLHIRETHNDKHGIATALNNLGAVYLTWGNVDTAKNYCLRALETRRELDDRHGIGSTLSNLGQISSAQGNYEEAIDYYQASIAAREAIDDQAGLGQALIGLGNVFIYSDNLTNAIECFSRSLAVNQKLDAKLQIAESMIGLAYVHSLKSKADLGEMFYEGVKLGREIESRFLMVRALTVFSVNLYHLGNFKDAALYIGLAKHHNNDLESITIRQLVSNLCNVLDDERLKHQMEKGATLDLETVITKLLESEI